MKGINLLPEELKPKSYAIKISKEIRKYAYGLLVIFLIGVVVMAASLFALKFQQNSLIKSEENLKSQVRTYEQTEQKLVLVQDRLRKIQNIFSSNRAEAGAEVLDLVVNNLPDGVTVASADLKQDAIAITFSALESKSLSRLYAVLSRLEFQKVALLSMGYSVQTGYRIELSIAK